MIPNMNLRLWRQEEFVFRDFKKNKINLLWQSIKKKLILKRWKPSWIVFKTKGGNDGRASSGCQTSERDEGVENQDGGVHYKL